MKNQPAEKTFSAFPAILLIAMSVAILLAWNVYQIALVRSNSIRILAQQDVQLAQAGQTEEKLRLMMADLVELAKSDADAHAIVKRYNIAFNNAAPDQAAPPAAPPAP